MDLATEVRVNEPISGMPIPIDALTLLQFFSCFFLTGLIWLIQIVHYPAFLFVDPIRFAEFHGFHSRRITWVVAPVMGVELLTAIGLCFVGPSLWILNLISVFVIWGLTGFVSVPIHNRLAAGFHRSNIHRLISTNWFRTGLWTLRSLFWFGYLLQTQN